MEVKEKKRRFIPPPTHTEAPAAYDVQNEFSPFDSFFSPAFYHATHDLLIAYLSPVDIFSLARTTKKTSAWVSNGPCNAYIVKSINASLVRQVMHTFTSPDWGVFPDGCAKEMIGAFMKRGMCFAGSSIMQAVLGVTWDGSDVDVFGCGQTDKNVADIYKYVKDWASYSFSEDGMYGIVIRNKGVLKRPYFGDGQMHVSWSDEPVYDYTAYMKKPVVTTRQISKINGVDLVLFREAQTMDSNGDLSHPTQYPRSALDQAMEHFDMPFCRCAIDGSRGVVIMGVDELVWRKTHVSRDEYRRIIGSRFTIMYLYDKDLARCKAVTDREAIITCMKMLDTRIAKYRARGFTITSWHEGIANDILIEDMAVMMLEKQASKNTMETPAE
jgi:hypothetical protein